MFAAPLAADENADLGITMNHDEQARDSVADTTADSAPEPEEGTYRPGGTGAREYSEPATGPSVAHSTDREAPDYSAQRAAG